MLNSYVLHPPGDADWEVDRELFAHMLRERWPTASTGVVGMTGSGSAWPPHVVWAIRARDENDGDAWLDGRLNEQGQRSSVFGDPVSVAEFTIWFRDLAGGPALVLASEEDRPPLVILPTMTIEDVIAHIR